MARAHTYRPSRPTPSVRRGVTLLEALLALTVVAIGLLAWLASAWRLAWLDGRTRADVELAASADRWREQLAVLPCAGVEEDSLEEGRTAVRWTVRETEGWRDVALYLEFPYGTAMRSVERSLARTCSGVP